MDFPVIEGETEVQRGTAFAQGHTVRAEPVLKFRLWILKVAIFAQLPSHFLATRDQDRVWVWRVPEAEMTIVLL